jgi:hypothetical protein
MRRLAASSRDDCAPIAPRRISPAAARQLQMATGELGFITLYAPEIDRASGHFDANLSFEGTLGQPVASG